MTSALILLRPGPATPPLQSDLEHAGIHVVGASQRGTLVQDRIRLAPDLLVCHDPHPDDGLFDTLEALHTHAPLPVIVFTADADAAHLERALAVGVQGWEVGGYAAPRLRPLVQLALARFRHERALIDRLADVTQRFEERKLVDRAKGLLMAVRHLPEDDAFKVLRGVAMQSGQRIGDVARHVIDSARQAADVNRSGQLRMLSQRIVKLQALRVAAPAEGAAEAARALLAQSVERAAAIVAGLHKDLSSATFGDLIDALGGAWQRLQAALAAAPARASLADTDALAEQLLRQSDTLTAALEAAGAAAPLQVVNTAGRQRMLSQRAAKLALLGAVAGAAVGDELARTRSQFEQALAQLHATPLSSTEIRGALAEADVHWQRLAQAVDALHAGGSAPAAAAVAEASEALLAVLDRLTGGYERSLQVLVG